MGSGEEAFLCWVKVRRRRRGGGVRVRIRVRNRWWRRSRTRRSRRCSYVGLDVDNTDLAGGQDLLHCLEGRPVETALELAILQEPGTRDHITDYPGP